MKKLLGEELRQLTTPSLVKYKQELEQYKKDMLAHIYQFAAELRNVKLELKDRELDLQIDLLIAEDERMNADSSVLYTPDNLH